MLFELGQLADMESVMELTAIWQQYFIGCVTHFLLDSKRPIELEV
jgi:hypothetical protein